MTSTNKPTESRKSSTKSSPISKISNGWEKTCSQSSASNLSRTFQVSYQDEESQDVIWGPCLGRVRWRRLKVPSRGDTWISEKRWVVLTDEMRHDLMINDSRLMVDEQWRGFGVDFGMMDWLSFLFSSRSGIMVLSGAGLAFWRQNKNVPDWEVQFY